MTGAKLVGAGCALLGAGAGLTAKPLAKAANFTLNAVRREGPLARGLGKVDGLDLPTLKQRVKDLGDDAVLADVGGGNVLGLGRAVQAVPGRTKEHAKERLSTRLKNNRNHILGAVKDAFSGENAFETVEALTRSRAKAAKKPYDKAYLAGALTNPNIVWLTTNHTIVQQAIRKARKFAPHLNGQPDTHMELLDRAYKHIGGMAGKTYRSGNGVVFHEMNALRVQLRDAIVSEVPVYGQALDIFSDASSMIDAINLGRNVFEESLYALQNAVKRLSKAEQEMAIIGAGQAIRDRIVSTNSGRDAIKTIFDNENTMEQLKAIIPDRAAFGQFKSAVQREITFSHTKNEVLGNSVTVRADAEIRDLENAATPAGRFASEVVDKGLTAASVDLVGRIVSMLPIGAGRVASGKTRDEIDRLLLSGREGQRVDRRCSGAGPLTPGTGGHAGKTADVRRDVAGGKVQSTKGGQGGPSR